MSQKGTRAMKAIVMDPESNMRVDVIGTAAHGGGFEQSIIIGRPQLDKLKIRHFLKC